MSILDVAWQRFAQYDAASLKKNHTQYRLRKWVAALGILATLFAILSSVFPAAEPAWRALGIKIILIILPIMASIMAAFINKFYSATDWLVLRAGAEQTLKEIYQYRTILQKTDRERRKWLEERLREIQTQVFTGLNGELTLDPYNGPIPPTYEDGSPRAYSPFDDLDASEYYEHRLREQLDWHVGKLNKIQKERIRLQVLILLAGGVGSFLAAMGGALSLWVALATAVTTAMLGWQEIRNLDMTVRNYSKVIIDLTAISDHWNRLEENEKTEKEYYRMVRDTETVLWTQNTEYVKSMQEAFQSARLEEEDLINDTVRNADDGNLPPIAESAAVAPPVVDEATFVPPPDNAGGVG